MPSLHSFFFRRTISLIGTGQNCTRFLNCVRGLNCTKTNLHEGTKLYKDTYARRQICTSDKVSQKILHGGSILHESKKTKKKYIQKNRKNS